MNATTSKFFVMRYFEEKTIQERSYGKKRKNLPSYQICEVLPNIFFLTQKIRQKLHRLFMVKQLSEKNIHSIMLEIE